MWLSETMEVVQNIDNKRNHDNNIAYLLTCLPLQPHCVHTEALTNILTL